MQRHAADNCTAVPSAPAFNQLQGSMGLKHRRRGTPSPPRLTAFAFGPQNLGWAAFTVLFLASDGGVYALCPVAPFGMRARGSMLRQLPGVNQRGTVHTWLLVSGRVWQRRSDF